VSGEGKDAGLKPGATKSNTRPPKTGGYKGHAVSSV
jgi:hypothetical protein